MLLPLITLNRFGYEPRSDTEKLKAAKALHKRRHVAAVLMQAHMRAYLGKKRANERYREWVMAALLCKVQARVRGVLARSRWQKRRLAALTKRCATSVAAAMRGTMSRRRVAQIRSGVSDNRRNEVGGGYEKEKKHISDKTKVFVLGYFGRGI